MITISSVYEKVHNFVKTHVTPEMKSVAKTKQENFSDIIQLSQESLDKAAEMINLNPTQTGIKAKGLAIKEKAVLKWEALSSEQQAYFKEQARIVAGQVKLTVENYWNSLSADEQQEAIARAKQSAESAKARWQSLPE